MEQPAELVRAALAVDHDGAEQPVERGESDLRGHLGGEAAGGTDGLGGVAAVDLAPGDAVLFEDHRLARGPVGPADLGHVRHPAQPPADGGAEVGAARVGEVEERRRGHGVLVHAVDGVALHDAARARVVVPPPLSAVSLQCTDPRGAGVGGREGLRVGAARVQPGQRLQGIGLVGEAGHVRAVSGDQPRPGGVREQRTALRPGREEAVSGRCQAVLHVHRGTGRGQGGEHPGRLDGVLRPSGDVQCGHPGEGVRQLGVAGLGGGPGDQRRVTEVGHRRQLFHQQARVLLDGVSAEQRALPVLGQEPRAQRGDGGVPGAGSAGLGTADAVGGDRTHPGEDEGVGARQVHLGQSRLGQREQSLGERVQRRFLVGQCF